VVILLPEDGVVSSFPKLPTAQQEEGVEVFTRDMRRREE